jgi:hypothetical protein
MINDAHRRGLLGTTSTTPSSMSIPILPLAVPQALPLPPLPPPVPQVSSMPPPPPVLLMPPPPPVLSMPPPPVSSLAPVTQGTSSISPNWPKHVSDAYRYFTEEDKLGEGEAVNKRDWGDGWLACLQSFFEFQRQAGFPDAGPSFPPATDKRPPEIAAWMKKGRRWKDMEIDDIETFSQQWWEWWSSLQPEQRIRNGQDSLTAARRDMDWSDLHKPGKNGFLLIMVSLVWWGNTSNMDESWLKAVLDVTSVLCCMGTVSGGTNGASRHPLSGSSVANIAGAVISKRTRGGNADVAEGSSKKRRKVR